MKLTAKADALKKIFQRAADAIPAKSSEPAFMNFLLTVTEDSLEILASDGNITLKTKLSGKDEKGENVIISAEPGRIQVPAKILVEMVTKMVGNVITLNLTDDTNLSVSDENTFYNINSIDAKEYPDIEMESDPSSSSSVTITGEQFISMYQCTSFAVAVKGARQCFLGINIKSGDGRIAFLATDACRLAQKTIEVPDAPEMSFTVPVKVLSMIAKTENLKEVKLELGDGKALFSVGDTIYQSRLYNGEFPSPEKIKPAITPFSLTVDSNEFISALDRVTLVTMGDATPLAKLTCSADGVEIAASSQSYGAAKEHLKNASFNGDIFQIGFNIRFVTDAVHALNSKEVTLAFAGEGRLFMVQNGDDSNLQIITPIRASV